MKIAYITAAFPAATFIYREVMALKKNNFPVEIFAIRRFPRVSSEAKHLEYETFYLLPVVWKDFLMAHLFFLTVHPIRYVCTLLFVLSRKFKNNKDRLRTFFHFCEAIYLAKIARKRGIDHVHAHYASHPCTLALVVSSMLGISFSFTAHAYDIWLDQLFLREKIEKCLFAITCSEYGKKMASGFVHRDFHKKIHTVYHGIDQISFSPARIKKNNNKFIILSVGTLKEYKGFCYLIEACKVVQERGIEFLCIIIGDGEQKCKLQELIDKNTLQNYIILTGFLDPEEVKKYYNIADIFVLPSVITINKERDNIPNVLVEAMSLEVPVISTNISGIPELVRNGVTGLLVEQKDVNGLASAIIRLYRDNNLQFELARNGKEYVLHNFDMNKNVLNLVALFKAYELTR